MAQSKEAATEAAGASISVGQSIGESIKDRVANDSVDVAAQPLRETSVSQNEVVAEKIVSAKEGTVTETQMPNYGNVASQNVIASTKYQDDLSSNLKSVEPNLLNNKVVHTMHINGAPAEEPNAESKESQPNKRETNQSQNTIQGDLIPANPSDGTSQIIIDGISVPGGESTLNKQSQDQGRQSKNPSTLQ